MPETHSKESDIPALSHIGSSVECCSSVVDSACDAGQNRLGWMPSWVEFFTAVTFFMKESLPRSRIRFLFTLIHQSIKGMIWVKKLGPRLRSYAPLIRR